MTAKTFLVVGSTGLVGEMLVKHLALEGNKVKALSRNNLISSDPVSYTHLTLGLRILRLILIG